MRKKVLFISLVLSAALGMAAHAQAQVQFTQDFSEFTLIQSPQSVVSAQQAYRETLAWAQGVRNDQAANYISTHHAELDRLYERVERSAYRNGVIAEFALAVISAEANYGNKISWARYDSWTMYELKSRMNMQSYPDALEDLDTALSELQSIMTHNDTLEEVLDHYWSGPRGEFNADSLDYFKEAVYKLWGALKPYAEERKKSESRNKYSPDYYNADLSDEPAWARIANGDLSGYSSSMSSMPLLAEQIKAFPDVEQAYVETAKHYNSKLTDAQALVIVRAILTYCQQTDMTVDPRLVMAMVAAESRFKADAVSKAGALGLGQLMPATAKSFGIKDPFDPIQNLYGCVKYLEREMHRWRGNENWLDLVAASYNAGAGAVQKYGGVPPYKETQNYVAIVKRYYYTLAPEKKVQR